MLLDSDDLAMAPWTKSVIDGGVPNRWHEQRRANVEQFRTLLADIDRVHVLPSSPDADCPFNGVLVFVARGVRDAVRRSLLDHDVYPAIHWPQHPGDSRRLVDLSERILAVPLDQRCGADDVDRIARHIERALDGEVGRVA